MNGFDTLSVITRSPVRPRILRYLLERGPAETPELTEHVDASRRTVSRTLSALEEEGLAELPDDERAALERTVRLTNDDPVVADLSIHMLAVARA
ncbi:helix-turn-helix domain-containing protein [Natrialba swarupiae]|uniref:Helix-turn-helix domain-containing protein n=1 Tax=Natrialba swarupiae TaxID=2448032 RepID=A0A5D5ALI2_9EURY|nr:helix-turn-helix domain-containing protein [Natrialba swarupiae]TYT61853.1 helix-turn-helix domain-containing protein [Natrialba swarupiae]